MENSAPTTFANFLVEAAKLYPQAPAILTPGRAPLTYERLLSQVTKTVRNLNDMGLGRNDRIAVIMPSSAEGGVASVCIETMATFVPLNPSLSLSELLDLLSRLKIKAVIIQEGSETAATQAAQQLGLRVINLTPLSDQESGLFRLSSAQTDNASLPLESNRRGFAQPDDIAMLVLTSGTTAASKVIPYTQRSACNQVYDNARYIELTPQDRLLSFMPMFHTTGVGYLVQALMTGGSTFILPGFDVKTFFESLASFKPTWFPAVTTLFKTIIEQALNYDDYLTDSSLRCIMALSMAIDVENSEALEAVLKTTVVQVYGATEAGIISANPLPPRPRKLGSAGVPVYSEVAMINDEGLLLAHGETGEIVVRGPGVMEGYEGDPEATAAAFINGWYRTGDLGYFDEDGFLYLVGRVKEVINRGGQKVSPGEVEQALLSHAMVEQAAVFAIPDARLGDEVGAAVILRKNSTAEISESDLRAHAASKLASYKIPRRIVFVDELPRNAIGKVQRIGMAEKLGLTHLQPVTAAPTVSTAHRSDLEQALLTMWSTILNRPPAQIAMEARFADVGGTSLNATQLIFKVREILHIPVTILDFFDAPTIADQATVLDNLWRNPRSSATGTNLIPIRPEGTRPPLFCSHAVYGGVFFYRNLVPYLPIDQPVYGLQAVGLDSAVPPFERVEDIVNYQLEQIRSVQTKGPYFLVGYSFGGCVALELARRLHDEFHQDAYVFCVGSFFNRNRTFDERQQGQSVGTRFWRRVQTPTYVLFRLPMRYKRAYLNQKIRDSAILLGLRQKTQSSADMEADYPIDFEVGVFPNIQNVTRANQKALKTYELRPFFGSLMYLHTTDADLDVNTFRALHAIAKGHLRVIDVPGTHQTVMTEPYVATVGTYLSAWIDSISGR